MDAMLCCTCFSKQKHKNISASESNYKSTNTNECNKHENKFGKNIKATLKVGAHLHHKCCDSKLDNSMYPRIKCII